MEKNLAKTYNPKKFEDRIYQMWEENGAFRAEVDKDKPFTIVMPPPRHYRTAAYGARSGSDAAGCSDTMEADAGLQRLVASGSDHASIATEVKGRKQNPGRRRGKEKIHLGREEFLKRAWYGKKNTAARITRQCRKLGDSCDWSRERFTMDEGCNKAVRTFRASV